VNISTLYLHDALPILDSFNDLFKHMALLKDKTKINHENFMTDLEFIYTNIFDNKLKYENESSKIIFGKGTYELNLNNFKKIHKRSEEHTSELQSRFDL